MTTRRLAWQRILAWLNDWLLILILPALIVPVGFLMARAGVELGQRGANLFGFLALVVPVTLWLAWREAAPRSATPGKRLRGLRVVVAASGAAAGFGTTLLRNTLKVAVPWQLGHQVAFGFATLGDGEIGRGLIVVSATCYAVMGVYLAGLFIGEGRPLYDRLSGTRVVRS